MIKFLFAMLLAAVIALAFLESMEPELEWYSRPDKSVYVQRKVDEDTREKFKKAMKYHGILFAEYDWETQDWVFFRDGQWCKLLGYLEK